LTLNRQGGFMKCCKCRQAPGVPSADIAPPEGDGIVDERDLDVLCDNWLAGVGN